MHARWVDVTASALPGGRHAWAIEACPAPHSDNGQQLAGKHCQQLPATAILRALPQPAWVCDTGCRVLAANPAFCRVAGCDESAAAGRPWMQLLLAPGPVADAAAVQRLQAAAAAGQAAQAHLLCASSGGSSFWGHVSVSPLESAAAADGGSSQLAVCTLLGAPGEPSTLHPQPVAAAAASAAPGPACSAPAANAAAVPPQLAQLCNQALASTSESVIIMDPHPASGPGNVIVWVSPCGVRLCLVEGVDVLVWVA